MSNEGVDTSRRRFLTAATSAVGAVGVGAALVPFISSMQPSARAQAAGAPVDADFSKLEPGALMTFEWRGKPIWVVYRTERNLKDLAKNDSRLKDPKSSVSSQQPKYCVNEYRSIKPKFLVLIGICTHLGCSPTYRPQVGPADLGPDWLGGWLCPCHGSRFDLAGRVFDGVPAPTNLVVPPYKYLAETKIRIGEDQGAA